MISDQHEGLLFNASIVFLGAANILEEARASFQGDDELEALSTVLLGAHFYMKERIRSLREPLLLLTVEQAERLSVKRDKLAQKLNAASDLFAFNAKDKLEASAEYIGTQQGISDIATERAELPQAAQVIG